MRIQAFLCLSLLSACVAADDEPEVEVDTSEIVGGDSTSEVGTPHVSLFVQRADGQAGICSGELITNDWVLSAKHCIDPAAGGGPITNVFRALGESLVATEVIQHPTLDAILVRLNKPLVMNGSDTGFEATMRSGWNSLQGKTLRCFGWGRDTPTSGSGTLRTADLPVSWDGGGDEYIVYFNGRGQYLWKGDSGGGCYDMSSGTPVLTGITSRQVDSRPEPTWQVSLRALHPWITSIVEQFANPSSFGHGYFCGGQEECLLGDVTGDGKDDLVALIRDTQPEPGRGDVWVAPSNGNGWGGAFWAAWYACVNGEVCKLADVDADNDDDLVIFIRNTQSGDGSYDVWVALSHRTGFDAPSKWHDAFCDENQECEVGDINGDRRADLVAYYTQTWRRGQIWIARSSGFSFRTPLQITSAFYHAPSDFEVADVNRDGYADYIEIVRVAATDPAYGDVYVALSTGPYFGMQAPQVWTDDFCHVGEECKVGDVNGDGLTDLIAFAKSAPTTIGDVHVAQNFEGLAFYPRQKWHDWFAPSTEVVQVGDVDGDRQADVVSFNRDTYGPSYRGHVWWARSRM